MATPQQIKTYNESVALLKENGWIDDPVHYHGYLIKVDSKGRKHQIQVDNKRTHLITCHRITEPNASFPDGMIGDFVGGKGPNRAVAAKTFAKPGYIDTIPSYMESVFGKK